MYGYIQGSAYPDRTLWATEFNVWCGPCDSGVLGAYDWTFCEGTAEYLMQHLLNNASGRDCVGGLRQPVQLLQPVGMEFLGVVRGGRHQCGGQDLYGAEELLHVGAGQQIRPPRGAANRCEWFGGVAFALLAFKHPVLGQVTIVGINTSGSAATLSGALASLPAVPNLDLYYTSPTANLATGGSVAVNNGTFSATIPANCVFTLTGWSGLRVAITKPPSGSSFNAPATIPILATATTSTGGVAKVEFCTGSAKLGEKH